MKTQTTYTLGMDVTYRVMEAGIVKVVEGRIISATLAMPHWSAKAIESYEILRAQNVPVLVLGGYVWTRGDIVDGENVLGETK